MDIMNHGGRLKFPNGLVLEKGLNKGVSKSDFAMCDADHLPLEVLDSAESKKQKKTKKTPEPELPVEEEEEIVE